MILSITIIAGMFLLIMAILDVKSKSMPSVIPSTIIVALTIIVQQLYNNFLVYGLISFGFGWLLYEMGYFHGIADIKAMIILGLTLTSMNHIYAMLTLIIFFNLIYQFGLMKLLKYKKGQEIPLIPMFLAVYITIHALIYLT